VSRVPPPERALDPQAGERLGHDEVHVGLDRRPKAVARDGDRQRQPQPGDLHLGDIGLQRRDVVQKVDDRPLVGVAGDGELACRDRRPAGPSAVPPAARSVVATAVAR
jgi:hypothetical protein